MHYEQLMAGVIQHDLMVDNLIYKVHFPTLSLFMKLPSQDFPVEDYFSGESGVPSPKRLSCAA